VHLDVELVARPPASIEAAVYYIISEAFTNAFKHSNASSISVTIATDESFANLRGTIADDGVGGAEPTEGSGLMGAIDRVDALGGRFTLESRPGRGTTISIELPIGIPEEPLRAPVTS
jgi:signal transduction histidine kinase